MVTMVGMRALSIITTDVGGYSTKYPEDHDSTRSSWTCT